MQTQTRRKSIAGFGLHLALDAYGCSPEALADVESIKAFLAYLPGAMGMTVIMGPFVELYRPPPGKPLEDWGVSGVVVIAESHLAIHTFPEQGFLSFDAFSCKEFDVNETTQAVVTQFQAQKVEPNLLDRGLEYPRERQAAMDLVNRQRRAFCGGGGGGDR
jgi:S-adenosylmethionine decarboxylase